MLYLWAHALLLCHGKVKLVKSKIIPERLTTDSVALDGRTRNHALSEKLVVA